MAKRKTIEVSEVLAIANRRLAEPNCHYSNPEYRRGIASLLEAILHNTGNYEGFNYHAWLKEGGYERWRQAGAPNDTAPFVGDETRRVYYSARQPHPVDGATVSLAFPMAHKKGAPNGSAT